MISTLVYSGKGGVGKTTTTINLAHALVAQGKKVYVLDADMNTPSVHVMLGNEQQVSENLRFNSMGLKMDGFLYIQGSMVRKFIRESIKDIKAYKPDVVLIDTPPSITDIHINLIEKLAISGVLIVSQPTKMSTTDVKRTNNFFIAKEIPVIGMIENMVNDAFNASEEIKSVAVPVLASVPLSPDFSDTATDLPDLTVYKTATEEVLKLASVEYAEEILVRNESDMTEEAIEKALLTGNPQYILRYYNPETWDFIAGELQDREHFPDRFLTEVTGERIKRMMDAFEDEEEAYFMITKRPQVADIDVFPGEIGVATLVTDKDKSSYYGVPRIQYTTSQGTVTLFPYEVMPVTYEEIMQYVQEGHIPRNDRRYMPPRQQMQEIWDWYGTATGLGSDWEEKYNALMGDAA